MTGPYPGGTGGRHSQRPSRPPAVALLAALAALTVAAVLVVFLVREVHWKGAPAPTPSAVAHAGQVSPARTADPSPSSTPAPRPRHRDPLRAAASFLATRAGAVMVTVFDVRTGQAWSFGRQRPQAEASVVKLDILETLLAERGQAGLPAADRSLARLMIEDSDNTAATDLWDAVGGASRIGAFNATAGLTRTTPSQCVQCPGFPWPGWGLTTTTSADQVTLLRKLIGPASPLSATARNYALSLLENVTPDQRWGVSGGVPPAVKIALKDGWLPLNDADTDWQINSVGWVSGRGRDYLMAMLSTGNPTEQYGIDTLSRVASIVWAGMR